MHEHYTYKSIPNSGMFLYFDVVARVSKGMMVCSS